MEAKRTELRNHATAITTVLAEVCGASNAGPLVREYDESGVIVIRIRDWIRRLSRAVTTDLGESESALRLPVPAGRPRCWLGLHERWEAKGKHKIWFRDCALRLYIGAEDEEAVQILRLEWVAPSPDPDGLPVYDGKHAGHPHWHIDRSALLGRDEYLRSLETLRAPEQQSRLEQFGQTSGAPPRHPVHDCSWLPKLHLPAQAGWMHAEWDARTVPGPHQSEPGSIEDLGHWWVGALRYFLTELAKAVPEEP
jgi:hypothetical protein